MDKNKKVYCRDMGLDCVFLACGKTEEEVLRKASEHAQAIHGIKGFSQEVYDKTRAAIQEGYCDYGDTEEMISEECRECYEGLKNLTELDPTLGARN